MKVIDEIEGDIRKAISSAAEKLDVGVGNKAWTKAILKSVSDLGSGHNCHICSSCSEGEYYGG